MYRAVPLDDPGQLLVAGQPRDLERGEVLLLLRVAARHHHHALRLAGHQWAALVAQGGDRAGPRRRRDGGRVAAGGAADQDLLTGAGRGGIGDGQQAIAGTRQGVGAFARAGHGAERLAGRLAGVDGGVLAQPPGAGARHARLRGRGLDPGRRDRAGRAGRVDHQPARRAVVADEEDVGPGLRQLGGDLHVARSVRPETHQLHLLRPGGSAVARTRQPLGAGRLVAAGDLVERDPHRALGQGELDDGALARLELGDQRAVAGRIADRVDRAGADLEGDAGIVRLLAPDTPTVAVDPGHGLRADRNDLRGPAAAIAYHPL